MSDEIVLEECYPSLRMNLLITSSIDISKFYKVGAYDERNVTGDPFTFPMARNTISNSLVTFLAAKITALI